MWGRQFGYVQFYLSGRASLPEGEPQWNQLFIFFGGGAKIKYSRYDVYNSSLNKMELFLAAKIKHTSPLPTYKKNKNARPGLILYSIFWR